MLSTRSDFFSQVPNGDIKDACGATFQAVENTNHGVRPLLKKLVTTDFFKYYYLDLYGDNCPFGDDSATCGNRACAVDTVEDESELPEIWKAKALGKFEKDSVASAGEIDNDVELSCVNENGGLLLGKHGFKSNCANKDYCVPDDDSAGKGGVYVSLADNPERYTGYSGPNANILWSSLYNENCFGYDGEESHSENPTGDDITEDIEHRLFFRLISGFHASVSTHLCYSHLNTTTGVWGPNLNCFLFRVGNFPERLSNLYFNYALVSRAVAKLRNYIDDIQFCPEASGYDQATRKQVYQLARAANKDPRMFNETKIFNTPEALVLKEEFRHRFHKVSQLMDCVGCDRCRLWGKVQVSGYGTALKIVFELDENDADDTKSKELMASLTRSELVSLINTFDRVSKSIEAVEYFRDLAQGVETFEVDDEDPKLVQKREGGRTELDHIIEAFKFVLRSYIDFPKNLWNLFLSHAIVYWNQFIGRDDAKARENFHRVNRAQQINVDL